MKKTDVKWTDSEASFVAENYAGMSPTAIGNHLGRSKMSVIGCAKRLRSKGVDIAKKKVIQTGRPKSDKSASKRAKSNQGNQDVVIQKVEKLCGGNRVHLLHVGIRHCRWMDGNYRDMMVCGEAIEHIGDSYCQYHKVVAYKPEKLRGVERMASAIR